METDRLVWCWVDDGRSIAMIPVASDEANFIVISCKFDDKLHSNVAKLFVGNKNKPRTSTRFSTHSLNKVIIDLVVCQAFFLPITLSRPQSNRLSLPQCSIHSRTRKLKSIRIPLNGQQQQLWQQLNRKKDGQETDRKCQANESFLWFQFIWLTFKRFFLPFFPLHADCIAWKIDGKSIKRM